MPETVPGRATVITDGVSPAGTDVDGWHMMRWEAKSVRADMVAQQLLDLRQAATDEEGAPVTRASVMNLIVYAPVADVARQAIESVDQLAMRHPSRVIVVAPTRGRDFKLDAEVILNRYPLSGHHLVFERAVLRPHGGAPEGTDTLVIPLLIPHLQSVLWWLGLPDPSEPALKSLSQICDRLIVDTNRGDPQLFSALAGLCANPDGRSRLVLGDMAWTRLDGFREVLAAVFDEPRRSGYLDGVERIEITGTRPARGEVSVAELLFAGWLSSRLGCSQPEKTRAGVTLASGATGRRVEVVFAGRAESASAAPLQGVRLAARSGRKELQVDLVQHHGEGHLELREAGHQLMRRTVPLPTPEESEVLSRELARMGRDRVFEDALLSAARIAAAREA